jgi:hypothetical protein
MAAKSALNAFWVAQRFSAAIKSKKVEERRLSAASSHFILLPTMSS